MSTDEEKIKYIYEEGEKQINEHKQKGTYNGNNYAALQENKICILFHSFINSGFRDEAFKYIDSMISMYNNDIIGLCQHLISPGKLQYFEYVVKKCNNIELWRIIPYGYGPVKIYLDLYGKQCKPLDKTYVKYVLESSGVELIKYMFNNWPDLIKIPIETYDGLPQIYPMITNKEVLKLSINHYGIDIVKSYRKFIQESYQYPPIKQDPYVMYVNDPELLKVVLEFKPPVELFNGYIGENEECQIMLLGYGIKTDKDIIDNITNRKILLELHYDNYDLSNNKTYKQLVENGKKQINDYITFINDMMAQYSSYKSPGLINLLDGNFDTKRTNIIDTRYTNISDIKFVYKRSISCDEIRALLLDDIFGIAVQCRYIDVVKLLLSRAVDKYYLMNRLYFDLRDNAKMYCPIHYAIRNQHSKMVELLVSEGCELDIEINSNDLEYYINEWCEGRTAEKIENIIKSYSYQ